MGSHRKGERSHRDGHRDVDMRRNLNGSSDVRDRKNSLSTHRDDSSVYKRDREKHVEKSDEEYKKSRRSRRSSMSSESSSSDNRIVKSCIVAAKTENQPRRDSVEQT